MADDTFNPINDETPASPKEQPTVGQGQEQTTPPRPKWRSKLAWAALYTLIIGLVFLIPAIRNSNKESREPVDHSQTLEEAYAAGAPHIDKPWTSEDYLAFQTYVESLPENAYPRCDSTKSGKLFAQMIGSTGHAMQDRPSDTHRRDAMHTTDMLGVYTILLELYHDADENGEAGYSLEMAHVLGLGLTVYGDMLDTDAFTWIANNPGATEEYNNLRQAMGMLLTGGMIASRSRDFSDKEQTIIAQYLLENGPAMFPYLLPSDKANILERARRSAKIAPSRTVRALMKQFVAEIEDAR